MITSEINIKSNVESVWKALTDKIQMGEWYFDIPDFELEVGKIFNFYEPGTAKLFHHQCVIKSIEPNKKFSHTWTHPSHSKGESLLTWLLEEKDGITKVVLQHEGLENFADAGPEFAPENYQMGWDGYIAMLKNYVYGIRKHTYQIEISASKKRVWKTLFGEKTYGLWTAAFCEGAYYKGTLDVGSRIHFLSVGGSGMYADVVFSKPNKSIYFQHLGELTDFIEQPINEKTERWSGAFENYILVKSAGKTLLTVEVDLSPDYVDFFDNAFPLGLKKVKELSEIPSL
ncbi:SRPBCC domain-containing protein [Flavobacterium sp. NKUCC04_CG]|uniref:SRPBCC family protein n=1 Tax=Flavobacterium sp. NKUCC04_CG TaxID=2842121 RepID=UPI001C5AB7DC|nr:SRPBCC domain-containing protein [Flavobacterium sp. NKUCC04_CG]MBW3519951.1 SRPBCC domain-containing protein [Flavobacterium sp. NKUCC04_CG]